MALTSDQISLLQAQYDTLSAALSTGALEIYVDGQKVTYRNAQEIRRTMFAIKQRLCPTHRPRIASVNLGGF